MDERKVCYKCKKRKEKKCTVTDEFVARKKSCDQDKFEKVKL